MHYLILNIEQNGCLGLLLIPSKNTSEWIIYSAQVWKLGSIKSCASRFGVWQELISHK